MLLLECKLIDELLSLGFFAVVQQAKLEVVYFLFLIEIYFVEDEAVVWESQVDPHLAHALDKLAEIKTAVEVFVEPSECVRKASKLLQNPVVHVLKKHVDAAVLLSCLHHRYSFEGVDEVGALVVLGGQGRWTMLEDLNDVGQVLVHKDRVWIIGFARVQHQVGKYVVQEVLREGDVVLGELEDERTFCDLANALLVALEKAVLQLLQSPELQVRGLS